MKNLTPKKPNQVKFQLLSINQNGKSNEIEIPAKLKLNLKHEEESLLRINDYEYKAVIKGFRQEERIRIYKKKQLVPIKKQNQIWKDNLERYKYKKSEMIEKKREELQEKIRHKDNKDKDNNKNHNENEYSDLKNSRKVTTASETYSNMNKQSKASYESNVNNLNSSNNEYNEDKDKDTYIDIQSKLLKNQIKYKNQIESFRLNTEKTVFDRIQRRIQRKRNYEIRKKHKIKSIQSKIDKRHKENILNIRMKDEEKIKEFKESKIRQYENWFFQIERLKKERQKSIRKNKENKENFEFLIKKTEERKEKLKEEIEIHLKSSEERRNKVFDRNRLVFEERNIKRREMQSKAMMNKLDIDENERKYREYVTKKQVEILKSALKMRFDSDLCRSTNQEKIILERMLIENRLGLYESNIYHLQENSILKKSVEKRKEMYREILRKEYEKRKAEEEKLKNGE